MWIGEEQGDDVDDDDMKRVYGIATNFFFFFFFLRANLIQQSPPSLSSPLHPIQSHPSIPSSNTHTPDIKTFSGRAQTQPNKQIFHHT